MSQTPNTPSSAGPCHGCGQWADKRYGGGGRWFVYCLICWLSERPELDLRKELRAT